MINYDDTQKYKMLNHDEHDEHDEYKENREH